MRPNPASRISEENMSKTMGWLLAVLVAGAGVSCTLDNPEAPQLAGPSTTGRSIELRAVPDHLVADGWSSSVIEAVLRGPNSERISGASVSFDIQGFVDLGNLAPLNGPRPTYGGVESGAVESTTDGDGVARARYWAPFRTDQPSDTVVTLLAREAGTNFNQALFAAGRTDIFLRAADRPFPSPFPTPQPGCPAPTAAIELSGLCQGGEIKVGQPIIGLGAGSTGGTNEVVTTYIWDWGDGATDTTTSSSESHTYTSASANFHVTVQLTVINSCGASAANAKDADVVVKCP
jgi:PKD domain